MNSGLGHPRLVSGQSTDSASATAISVMAIPRLSANRAIACSTAAWSRGSKLGVRVDLGTGGIGLGEGAGLNWDVALGIGMGVADGGAVGVVVGS